MFLTAKHSGNDVLELIFAEVEYSFLSELKVLNRVLKLGNKFHHAIYE